MFGWGGSESRRGLLAAGAKGEAPALYHRRDNADEEEVYFTAAAASAAASSSSCRVMIPSVNIGSSSYQAKQPQDAAPYSYNSYQSSTSGGSHGSNRRNSRSSLAYEPFAGSLVLPSFSVASDDDGNGGNGHKALASRLHWWLLRVVAVVAAVQLGVRLFTSTPVAPVTPIAHKSTPSKVAPLPTGGLMDLLNEDFDFRDTFVNNSICGFQYETCIPGTFRDAATQLPPTQLWKVPGRNIHVPLYSSHDLTVVTHNHIRVKYVLVVQHGNLRNANDYFCGAVNSLFDAGMSKEKMSQVSSVVETEPQPGTATERRRRCDTPRPSSILAPPRPTRPAPDPHRVAVLPRPRRPLLDQFHGGAAKHHRA